MMYCCTLLHMTLFYNNSINHSLFVTISSFSLFNLHRLFTVFVNFSLKNLNKIKNNNYNLLYKLIKYIFHNIIDINDTVKYNYN